MSNVSVMLKNLHTLGNCLRSEMSIIKQHWVHKRVHSATLWRRRGSATALLFTGQQKCSKMSQPTTKSEYVS